MGIRNLTQTIKRRCPQLIENTTLDNFRNKTLALDGNLLMQKFHHGNPNKRPLVLWYRFLMSLRERYNITPVCIFDGPTRLPQKTKEILKRQAAKDLLLERARLEQERSDRVDSAALAVSAYNKLPKEMQELVFNQVKTTEAPPSLDASPYAQDVASLSSQLDQFELDDELYNFPLDATGHEEPPTAQEDGLTAEEELDQSDLVFRFSNIMNQASSAPLVAPSPIQKRLSSSEEIIYSSLLDPTADDMIKEDSIRALEHLQVESAALSQKYTQRSRSVVQEDYNQLKTLIEAMGIPYLVTSEETPHEAEALGAVLMTSGFVDAVLTEDSDVLLYDATMVRNALGYKEATLINGKAVREALGFDRDQFIDMCLLCGSDFAETLPGIGHVKAYELIKEHGSIEAIIQAVQATGKLKHLPPDLNDYLQQIVLAREVFHGPPCPPTDPAVFQMKNPSPDLDQLLATFELKGEYVPEGVWAPSEQKAFSL